MTSLRDLVRTCAHDPRFLGGLIAVPFIALVAHTAVATGILLLLFPELGALSMDVFSRPGGLWARHPVHLAFTPALTAILGLMVTRHLSYGFFSIGLVVAGSILILQALKSPIAPAISAAVLPLALGIKSWWYPGAILLGTMSLALASTLHRRILGPDGIAARAQTTDATDDLMEETAGRYQWMVFFCVFLRASLLLVHVTGWRLILFPPAVALGMTLLTAIFLLHRRLALRRFPATA